ncbi:MAG TPA: hypothetical protein DD434_00585 [Bacteroidales bacterium]|nr:hypothetical protein [Bacteroidales bacterium]
MELVKQEQIENKIFFIRNVYVILDKDLALYYDVKPIRLREQMKRNPNRFPDDFVFQLNKQEVDFLLSQNAIPSIRSLGGTLPYGASLKDLGKKWFAFSQMNTLITDILNRL